MSFSKVIFPLTKHDKIYFPLQSFSNNDKIFPLTKESSPCYDMTKGLVNIIKSLSSTLGLSILTNLRAAIKSNTGANYQQ